MSENLTASPENIRKFVALTVSDAAASQLNQPDLSSTLFESADASFEIAWQTGVLDQIYGEFTRTRRAPGSIDHLAARLHETMATQRLQYEIPAQNPDHFPLPRIWSTRLLDRIHMLQSDATDKPSTLELIAQKADRADDTLVRKGFFDPDLFVIDLDSLQVVADFEMTTKKLDVDRDVASKHSYIRGKRDYLTVAIAENPVLFSPEARLNLVVLKGSTADKASWITRTAYDRNQLWEFMAKFIFHYAPEPSSPTIADIQQGFGKRFRQPVRAPRFASEISF